jgi:glycosyltransferase involved in cell wall biosynthesis
MKVLVVNNAAPFIRGGAEELADRLVRELNATRGVEAELLRIPFRWEPAECIADQILLNLNFKLYQVDRVIALKFPAYLIPHECKILWLLHQFRQAYDLYESGMSHLCNHQFGKHIAQMVRAADQQCFAKCRAIYTNSPVTQSRLRKYNGFESRVLYPPLLDEEKFVGGEYGDYIFAGGRIGPGKRQHLLIEAIATLRSCPKLIVAGPLDDADYGAHLKKLVEQHDCGDRIDLRFGFHGRDEIARLVNGSVACAYVPIDEDSLGYVTMEAFSAGKSAITTTDAGGVLEIVRQGETGLVSDAEPQSIAKSFAQIADDRNMAIEMGRAAKALLASMGLSWQDTVARLLNA